MKKYVAFWHVAPLEWLASKCSPPRPSFLFSHIRTPWPPYILFFLKRSDSFFFLSLSLSWHRCRRQVTRSMWMCHYKPLVPCWLLWLALACAYDDAHTHTHAVTAQSGHLSQLFGYCVIALLSLLWTYTYFVECIYRMTSTALLFRPVFPALASGGNISLFSIIV